MQLNRTQIERLLPHRAPFILLDRLLEADTSRFIADFRVMPGTIFLENNLLREFALIEHIAQCGAVGLHTLHREPNEKPGVGFLGSISKLTLYDLPKVGDTFYSEVKPVHRVANMFLLQGMCYAEDKKLIECTLTLVNQIPG